MKCQHLDQEGEGMESMAMINLNRNFKISCTPRNKIHTFEKQDRYLDRKYVSEKAFFISNK